MDEREITQNLIRALMFYGITKNWDIPKLLGEFERYGRDVKEQVYVSCNEA